MISWSPWAWWFESLRTAKDRQPDEEPRITREMAALEDIDDEPWRLRTVGAWAGWGSYAKNSSIERDIKFAKRLGLGRIDVIVNDHSGSRSKRKFGTYNASRIQHYCQRLLDEGFHVHLMTWWMPHEDYIKAGGDLLCELAAKCGARSVMLDAEEPWTQASAPMDWEKAAELTKQVLKGVRFGVTGIGYTPVVKVGPLVRVSEYMCPQCYSTSRNTLDPATATPQLVKRWTKHFGDRDLVVGLAGYRQKGRPGYTKERFMTDAFHAAEATEPLDVVYWSLRHIRSSRSTANIIQKLAARAVHRTEP